MKQSVAFVLLSVTLLLTDVVLAQGCAQCTPEVKESISESAAIGVEQNSEAMWLLILTYVGIPILVIAVVLGIVFRKKIFGRSTK